MNPLTDLQTLESTVRRTVASVTIADIHTHLFPPSHGELLLWGVDELITYHYLVAELFTLAPRDLKPQDFWKLPKSKQADIIWEYVFLRNGPLSEGARGVLTTLNALGLDVAGRNLAPIRKWFAEQKLESYLPRVFDLANLDYAVMTNNPFVAEEAACWRKQRPGGVGLPVPGYLKAALRIDTLILDWPKAARTLREDGYKTKAAGNAAGFAAARKFLAAWAARMKPVYMAASLPPDFAYPSRNLYSRVMQKVVLPAAAELNLPVAMMIGVRKQVNPALGDGGDGVGQSDLLSVQHLCQQRPDVKFLVTALSRVDQHELAVLGRKFGNLHVFGCWWFCNTPSIIAEIVRLRLELLGTAMTCQHSDARVLDQLLYKWSHTRRIVADVLAEKYRLQFEAGWRPSEEEIRRDVRAIFGGSFEAFLAK